MEKVLKRLGVELPDYSHDLDPTKQKYCDLEWSIPMELIGEIDKQYKCKLKMVKKQKSAPNKHKSSEIDEQKKKQLKRRDAEKVEEITNELK